MMHEYSFLSPQVRTLAFIRDYMDAFEFYCNEVSLNWVGDPVSKLDPYNPTEWEHWEMMDDMREICDKTNTHYEKFWKSAFYEIVKFRHRYPTPPVFYNKKGGGRNDAFLRRILLGVERVSFAVSQSPYYKAENYVASPQQVAYFAELKRKFVDNGREVAMRRLVEEGKLPEFVLEGI